MEKAGEGNRTLVSSLEGYSFTIKLHPRPSAKVPRRAGTAKFFFRRVRSLPFSGLPSSTRRMKVARLSLKSPNVAEIVKQLQVMTPDAWGVTAQGIPNYRDFPGLPVRSLITIGASK